MTLTKNHQGWLFFCAHMQRMDPEKPCGGKFDFTLECLNLIPGIGIPESIQWLRQQGGHCDCEVIFNVILPSLDEMEEA